MTRIKQQIRAFFVGLAIVAAGGVVGTTVSAFTAPASAVAHKCEADECEGFLIFWERCADNPGQTTACEADSDGCTTTGCGHP